MALPTQFKSARMTNDTLGVNIDNKVAEIEQALCDFLGLTIDTNITESPLGCDNSGRITKALLRLYAAGPVGMRYRDTTSGKEVRIALSGTNVVIDENTGTESVPVWTNRATLALATGVLTFTAIPVLPNSDPTADNEAARKKYVVDQDTVHSGGATVHAAATNLEKVANKGAASGYAELDAGTKVPTAQLGTGTPSATTFLCGDRSWSVAGIIQQIVCSQTAAYATGSTAIPFDDTIPQITEGTQFLSVAITPKSASSKIRIEVIAHFGSTGGGGSLRIIGALFKDTGADAIAACYHNLSSVTYNANGPVTLSAIIDAVDISEHTFKFRAGSPEGSEVSLNGESGARKLGGVLVSSIVVTEYTYTG